jgi:hypothetical protein
MPQYGVYFVVQRQDGSPVAGVTVIRHTGYDWANTTDKNGIAHFKNFPDVLSATMSVPQFADAQTGEQLVYPPTDITFDPSNEGRHTVHPLVVISAVTP